MDDRLRRKIERYLMNARRFLWGLTNLKEEAKAANQRKRIRQENTYRWLRSKGIEFKHGNYTDVTRRLLHYPGIEEVLKNLLIPSLREKFPEDTMEILKSYWQRGELPSLAEIEKLRLSIDYYKASTILKWRPFFEITPLPSKAGQYDYYVESWGDFASVWFEEIDPWNKEKEAHNER